MVIWRSVAFLGFGLCRSISVVTFTRQPDRLAGGKNVDGLSPLATDNRLGKQTQPVPPARQRT
jgi:hypothetical protein